MTSQNCGQLLTIRDAMAQEPSLPLAQTAYSTISGVTYLLLQGGGDQAPQFGKAAVDAVPAPLLYDLKNNDKSLHAGTSRSDQHALMDTHSHFPSQYFRGGGDSILTL